MEHEAREPSHEVEQNGNHSATIQLSISLELRDMPNTKYAERSLDFRSAYHKSERVVMFAEKCANLCLAVGRT